MTGQDAGRHRIHHAHDLRECSATYGGPNYVERAVRIEEILNECRIAGHVPEARYLAERIAAIEEDRRDIRAALAAFDDGTRPYSHPTWIAVRDLLAHIDTLTMALRDAERERDGLHALYMEYVERAQGLEFRAEHAEQRVAGLQDLIRRIREAKEQTGRARERHDKRAIAWSALRDEIDAALTPPPPAQEEEEE